MKKLSDFEIDEFVSSGAEWEEFVAKVDYSTVWLNVACEYLRLNVSSYHDGCTHSGNWVYTQQDVLDEFEERSNSIYLEIKTGTDFLRIPVNLLTTPFSLNDRAGVRSKLLSDYLANDMLAEYAFFVNEGFRFYGKEKVQILVREGVVLAIHTKKYKSLSQSTIYSYADMALRRYPEGKFICGRYTHERSYADYAVCSSSDTLFEKYSKAWKRAGLPEKLLKESFALLEVSTGDTGKYTVSIFPKLRIGNSSFPLGTGFSIKHSSRLTPSEIAENLGLSYAALTDGINSVENMLKKNLMHPYAAFVRVATKIGLTKKAKKAISAVLEDFKANYIEGEENITAFDVYYNICEIQNYTAYKELSADTKLQVYESLNRLLHIDWEKEDYSGKNEF